MDSTYDDCAGLSAIEVTVKGATGSSPCQVMLFHHGEFLGTATEESYGFSPRLAQTGDDSVQITYRWLGENDATANPTQSSVATFAYDDAAGKVVMSGQVPPGA